MYKLLIVIVVLGCARAGYSAPITYTINQPIGTGSVTGTIETDGTIGTLHECIPANTFCGNQAPPNNFLTWDLFLSDGTQTLELTPDFLGGNSAVNVRGDSLEATATTLLFDTLAFEQNGLLVTELLVQAPYLGSGMDAWAVVGGANGDGEGVMLTGTEQFTATGPVVVLGTVDSLPTPEPTTVMLFVAGGWLGRRRFLRRSK